MRRCRVDRSIPPTLLRWPRCCVGIGRSPALVCRELNLVPWCPFLPTLVLVSASARAGSDSPRISFCMPVRVAQAWSEGQIGSAVPPRRTGEALPILRCILVTALWLPSSCSLPPIMARTLKAIQCGPCAIRKRPPRKHGKRYGLDGHSLRRELRKPQARKHSRPTAKRLAGRSLSSKVRRERHVMASLTRLRSGSSVRTRMPSKSD